MKLCSLIITELKNLSNVARYNATMANIPPQQLQTMNVPNSSVPQSVQYQQQMHQQQTHGYPRGQIQQAGTHHFSQVPIHPQQQQQQQQPQYPNNYAPPHAANRNAVFPIQQGTGNVPTYNSSGGPNSAGYAGRYI